MGVPMPPAMEARKSKTGLLLSPASSFDGDLVGLRLARNLVGRMPAGRRGYGQPEESLTSHQPASIPISPSRGRTW